MTKGMQSLVDFTLSTGEPTEKLEEQFMLSRDGDSS